jgi:hypothetical protein
VDKWVRHNTINRVTGFLAIVMLLLPGLLLSASIEEVKVAYLYNIIKLTSWADTSGLEQSTICIYGNYPEDFSIKSLNGRTLKDKKLLVKHIINKNEDFSDCQVLYIPAIEAKHWDKIYQKIKNQSLLSLSDSSGFLERHGMIEFLIRTNKLRFRINKSLASDLGITFSAKLLEVSVK